MVLAAWTLAVAAWILAVRIPAMHAAGIDMAMLVGTTGAHADRRVTPSARWPAHNYQLT